MKSLEYYLAASNIVDGARKRAVLLHLAGQEVQDIFLTFTDTGDDYDGALNKLTEYFAPKKNIPFERHVFRQGAQEPGESVESLITRLRTLAKSCQFENVDDVIRDQLVEKCLSGKLRRRLLREPELTLEKSIQIAKLFQASDRQASQMETPSFSSTSQGQDSANTVDAYSLQSKSSGRDFRQPRGGNMTLTCFCCGLSGHRAKDPSCPANGKSCNKCGKSGHFGRVCKSSGNENTVQSQKSTVNLVAPRAEHESSDDEYLFTLGNSNKRVPIKINGQEVPMIIDSGSTVNVLDANSFGLLTKSCPVKLFESRVQVFLYGADTPLPVKGSFTAMISSDTSKKSVHANFVVVQTLHGGSLLGKQSAIELDLLRVGPPTSTEVNYVSPRSTVDSILSNHSGVFEGVGKLTDYQLTIHTDPNVMPVAQPLRRTPFHVRKDIEKKMKELQDLDIIEDVEGPTPWVSPLVAVPKSNGEIRICVDMRRVNEAIVRQRHPIPTLEETLQDLNGATVLSKLDLRWGYHQVELHPDSRTLTTFSTHLGLKRYKRLIFGLSSASEIYQYVVQQVLQGIPGARNISDDIIVFGKDQESHDQQLELTLARLQERGLTLNREKCVFSVGELVFFGHKVSAAGISPDEKKVDAVKQARPPQTVSELRSFLGLANYCARYIPHFATIAEPLRQLTRMGVKWSWTDSHQKAFDQLKSMLTSDCVMSHYNPSAETQLKVDASPFGLGAVLLQASGDEVHPIAYASRTLTDVLADGTRGPCSGLGMRAFSYLLVWSGVQALY